MAGYDVFLSHNRDDQAAVEWIARRLRSEAGLNPFLDTWHLIPGTPWQEGIEEALAASEAIVVCVGPSGISPWHNEQMRTGIDRAVRSRDDVRVIPLLLPGSDPEVLPQVLGRRTYVDFRPGLDDADAFARLVAGILGQPPEGAAAFALPDEPAPYPGLLPFKTQQSALFFGRAGERDRLHARLREAPFVAVVGASGSGKSSLVLAGLLPALDKDWLSLVLVPGARPLRALADALATLGPAEGRLRLADDLEARLAERGDGLRTAALTLLAERPEAGTLLIVVDQFEELFTLVTGSPEDVRRQQRQFIDNLVDAAQSPDLRVRVVLMLRADFVRPCLDLARLRVLLEANQLLLGPMSEDALREAIVKPAQAVGAMLEKGLVGRLVADMRDQAGALPLLGFTLAQLWQRRQGVWLTHAAYEEIGGISGAIDQRADAVYGRLSERQQELARSLFVRMVSLGEGSTDTRRRVRRDELEWVDARPDEVQGLINILSRRDVRLVAAEADTIELAHEALIERWGRLRAWLEEDRDALRVQRGVTEAACEWDENKQDEGYLYRGARLAQAEEWARGYSSQVSLRESAFLDASVALRDRDRAARERLRRRIVLGLAAGLIVSLILAALATIQLSRAERAEASARAQLLSTQGRLAFEQEPLLGLRLALEGWAHLPSQDDAGHASIQETVREQAAWGRLFRLGGDVRAVYTACGGDVLVLARQDAPAELRRAADGAVIATLTGTVADVRCSPDPAESYLIVESLAQESKRIEMWRMPEGEQVLPAPGLEELLFCPDAACFVANYADAPSELRRTADGERIATLADQATEVLFSTPGFFLARYADGSAELRRTADGSLVAAFAEKLDSVYFSPDKSRFVAYYGGRCGLYRTDDGEAVPLTGEVDWISFSPDPAGSYFLVSYATVPGELRRTADSKIVATLSGPVYDMGFCPDQGASCFWVCDIDALFELRRSTDGSVIVRSENPGDQPFPDYPEESCPDMEFSPDPDATFLLMRYPSGYTRLWRTVDGSLVWSLPEGGYWVAFSPDGRYLVLDYTHGPLVLIRAEDGATILTVEERPGNFDFSPDENATYLVLEYLHGLVQVYESESGAQVTDLAGELHEVAFAADPVAPYFRVGYTDARDELRRVRDGEIVSLTDGVEQISLSEDPDETYWVVNYDQAPTELIRVHDGEVVRLSGDVEWMSFFAGQAAGWFAVNYLDAPAELRRTDTGALVTTLPGAISAIHAGGLLMVVEYRDAPAESRRVGDGEVIATLGGLAPAVAELAFGPHKAGIFFLVERTDGQMELWRADSGSSPLSRLGLGVMAYHFDPMGRRLAVAYADGRAYLLDLDWLSAMRGEAADLDVEELARLACAGPLSAGLLDEATVASYLTGWSAAACKP